MTGSLLTKVGRPADNNYSRLLECLLTDRNKNLAFSDPKRTLKLPSEFRSSYVIEGWHQVISTS